MKTYAIELVNLVNVERPVIQVAEDQFILTQIEQAGLRLPVGCRIGACITCAARLMCGEVDQSQARCLKPEQIAAGYVLLCIAYPRSNCQFEVGFHSQKQLYRNPFQATCQSIS